MTEPVFGRDSFTGSAMLSMLSSGQTEPTRNEPKVSKLDAVAAAARDIELAEQDLREAVADALTEGHTVAAVARAANVTRQTIYVWQADREPAKPEPKPEPKKPARARAPQPVKTPPRKRTK